MPFTDEQRARLRKAAETFGLSLSDEQVAQLEKATDMLLEWNERINLTALKTVDDVVDKHLIDSLAAGSHIGPNAFVLDIGTGGGFPGVPLKIASPDRRLLLIDGTAKKVNYVQTVIQALGLQNITAMHQRAEDKGFQFGLSGQLDVVTARAVARTEELLKLASPYLKKGGRAVLYKGIAEAEEVMEGAKFAGYQAPDLHLYELPKGDRRALLVFTRK